MTCVHAQGLARQLGSTGMHLGIKFVKLARGCFSHIGCLLFMNLSTFLLQLTTLVRIPGSSGECNMHFDALMNLCLLCL